jgi:hypothetical protein
MSGGVTDVHTQATQLYELLGRSDSHLTDAMRDRGAQILKNKLNAFGSQIHSGTRT